MSVANPETAAHQQTPVAPDSRGWVGVLFATHRRVAVRTAAGTAGPQFCTCGDVWPCRREELAVRILDSALTAGP